jgi:hypothetical protein
MRLLSAIFSKHDVGAALLAGVCVAFLCCVDSAVRAVDLSGALPTKSPPATASASYDWTGVYVGGHLGYATGSSNWTATQAGSATPLAGSLDLFNGFNAFGDASKSARPRSSDTTSETELARYIRERDQAQEQRVATAAPRNKKLYVE